MDNTDHGQDGKRQGGKLDMLFLNRIEGNCEYLSVQLNSYGYLVSITVKTDWAEG